MKTAHSPNNTAPAAAPAAQADLRELLRLSLDGILPQSAGLSHWFDRLEAGR